MDAPILMKYFVEQDDQLSILRNCVLETTRARRARLLQVAKGYGADAMVMRGCRAIGLSWHMPAGPAAENRPGLSFYGSEEGESADFVYHNYLPNKRFSFGRTLAKELERLNLLTRTPSEQLVQALDADRHIPGRSDRSRTGMALFVTVAGIVKGKVVLKVPTTPDEPFEAPVGMAQIKHSEFIALTEE